MSLQTTVGIAKIGTKSLRATVPEGIVAFLEIQSGDKLEWRMDIQNGQRIVLVRKAVPQKESTPTKTRRK
jgi:hypothetical protein